MKMMMMNKIIKITTSKKIKKAAKLFCKNYKEIMKKLSKE